MKRLSVYMLCALALIFGPSVAGAASFELNARGDEATINDAVFHEFTLADQTSVSAGTGVIDPFLTIQKKGSEKGYNSDASPLVMDTTRPAWNHSLTFSQLIAGPDPFANYFEFLLDINEPTGGATSKYISLNEFQVYATSSLGGAFSGSLAQLAAGSDLIYTLGNNTIRFDYGLWSGSGQNIDVGIYIPKTLFGGVDPGDNIYVYAQFGLPNFRSGDGFEEFIQRTGGTSVPEAGTLLILGTGLVGLVGYRRMKRMT